MKKPAVTSAHAQKSKGPMKNILSAFLEKKTVCRAEAGAEAGAGHRLATPSTLQLNMSELYLHQTNREDDRYAKLPSGSCARTRLSAVTATPWQNRWQPGHWHIRA